jgi:hypothetical protein
MQLPEKEAQVGNGGSEDTSPRTDRTKPSRHDESMCRTLLRFQFKATNNWTVLQESHNPTGHPAVQVQTQKHCCGACRSTTIWLQHTFLSWKSGPSWLVSLCNNLQPPSGYTTHSSAENQGPADWWVSATICSHHQAAGTVHPVLHLEWSRNERWVIRGCWKG